MFIRLTKYLAVVEERAAASAMAATMRTDLAQVRADLRAECLEVRRLTNVIIHLKEQGMVLPPGAGDQVWGKYTQAEYEAPKEGYEEPTAEDREVSIEEAEFNAELEAALEAE